MGKQRSREPRDQEPTNQQDPAPCRSKKQRRDAHGQDPAAPQMPQKKFYRQRAHANPFSDHALTYPVGPADMDWAAHYPEFAGTAEAPEGGGDRAKTNGMVRDVEIADIGCGYGGLLFALAPQMPHTLVLGMEIRLSVAEFVQNKIHALRSQQQQQQQQQRQQQRQQMQHPSDADAGPPHEKDTSPRPHPDDAPPARVPGAYQNISCVRANAMKFLPNFFRRAQLHSIYLCFPDPHFKARKHKQRIVSGALTAEYAYVLRPGGVVYTVTDVEDLHAWMAEHFGGSASFARVAEGDAGVAAGVALMRGATEEGRKVLRNGGRMFVACWRRVADPPWPGEG